MVSMVDGGLVDGIGVVLGLRVVLGLSIMLLPLHMPLLPPTPTLLLLMVLPLRTNAISNHPSTRSQTVCCLKSSSSRASHSLQIHVLMAHSMEMEHGKSSILAKDLWSMMRELTDLQR